MVYFFLWFLRFEGVMGSIMTEKRWNQRKKETVRKKTKKRLIK